MLVSTFTTLRAVAFDLRAAADSPPATPQSDDLARAAQATLAYFDIFDFPLTGWEVYKYLWRDGLDINPGFLNLKKALDANPFVGAKEGFYFLAGRDGIVSVRKQRYNIASQKYRRARYISHILSLMPYVRMIAVSNSLAYDNTGDTSDIDLFIIAAKNKIWTVRFFTILFLKIFGLRPKAGNKKNTICLNFFVSEAALNLKELRIEDDVYFMYWLKLLKPMYDAGNVFQDLCDANGWVNNYINSHEFSKINIRRRVRHYGLTEGLKLLVEKIVSSGRFEKFFKLAQLKMMPSDLKNNANKRIKENIEVAINDKMLKFHHGSKKEKFRDEWKVKIAELLNC